MVARMPHSNCPLCGGTGVYELRVMSGSGPKRCPCYAIEYQLLRPNTSCGICMGGGWILRHTFKNAELCKCLMPKYPSPRRDTASHSPSALTAEPRNTDWNQDYSYWPGPTLTSFYVDTRLDGKKDGKGDWIIAGRSDDHRKQRFHIDSIEMERDEGNHKSFIFRIHATELDGMSGGM